ncbi:MAG: hypothetical protein ACKOPM_17175 [Novosphingobium sp.]
MRAPHTTLLTAALAIAFSATGAMAQDTTHATQRIEFHGDAPAGCVANSARASKQIGTIYQAEGPTSGLVTFPNLVDESTATARASSIELAVPVVCNTSHYITVRSFNGALVRQGAGGANSAGGFSESLGYNVGLQWQDLTAQLNSSNTNTAIAYGQPAKGDLIVDIAVPRGSQPLVAGTYTDAVVVEIRPSN